MRRLGLQAAAVAVLGLGCNIGGGGGGGGGGPAAAKASDFCNQLVDAFAARAQACFGGAADGWTRTIALFKASCSGYDKSVAATRMKYDQSQGTACLEAIRNQSCYTLFGSGGPFDDPNGPCKKAVAGQVAADGQCYDASECAGDSSCGTESACPATCKAKSPASGACQYDEDCAFGTRCASDGQTGTCVARTAAAETQPCRGAADTECEPQLYCEGGSNTDSGTCKKRVSTGACAERDACELKQYCAGYDPPNTATGTCTAQKTSGQDCTGSGGEGFGSSECEPFTSCVGGKCTVWPGVDGQCGKVNDNYIGCLESWCDAPEDPPGPGTCRAYKKAGDACNPQRGGDFFGGGECGSGSCDQATSKCVESCLLRQP